MYEDQLLGRSAASRGVLLFLGAGRRVVQRPPSLSHTKSRLVCLTLSAGANAGKQAISNSFSDARHGETIACAYVHAHICCNL